MEIPFFELIRKRIGEIVILKRGITLAINGYGYGKGIVKENTPITALLLGVKEWYYYSDGAANNNKTFGENPHLGATLILMIDGMQLHIFAYNDCVEFVKN